MQRAVANDMIRLAVALGDVRAGVSGVRPVCSSHAVLKGTLLAEQILGRGVGDGHEARVDGHAVLLALDGDVVVRRARVPDDEIARIRLDLDPFAAVVAQPLHALIGEAVPLLGPRGDAVLGAADVVVELLAQEVRALGHDEPAVVGPVGQQVDEALEAAEARAVRILVLVRPRLVGLEVRAVGEADVDGVERHEQVLGVVDALERPDDAGLGPDGPHKVLVRRAVVEEHALFRDDGELLGADGQGVVAVVAKAAERRAC